ncbi:MAG: lysophospholipase [Clostridia bacterium]|nr:lysophospholipase [Clostridia bacterium]
MKKSIRKIISLMLCLAIVAGFAMPSFAAPKKTAFIVVSGMNTFPLSENETEKVFPMPGDVIAKMVLKLIVPATMFLLNGNYDKMSDGVIPALYDAFGKLACDDNGDSIYNVSTQTFNSGNLAGYEDYFMDETSDEHGVVRAGIERFGAENTYFFNYDWRISPLDHADELNKLIKLAKEETGCDRVALAAFSMGGTVTMSYLYKYGSADVDSVTLCSTAFQGTTCVGSLFTGDMDINMYALMRRLAQLTRKNATENLVLYFGNLLEATFVNAALEKFVNGITDNTKDRIYDELLIPIFGHMQGLWALVNDSEYEKAKDWMLDKNVNAEFIKEIDEYHYNVQQKAAQIIASAQEDTNFYITAQYNMQGLPISEIAATSNNDYLIEATFASGGAVCADLDTTLGENYTQQVKDGHNHISFDGQIDASTCMLPEHTWLIRDMGHVDYPYGESTDFILWLAESEDYVTVFDNEKYPQFMQFDYGTNALTPVDETINDKTDSDKAYDIAVYITKMIADICIKVLENVKTAVV